MKTTLVDTKQGVYIHRHMGNYDDTLLLDDIGRCYIIYYTYRGEHPHTGSQEIAKGAFSSWDAFVQHVRWQFARGQWGTIFNVHATHRIA